MSCVELWENGKWVRVFSAESAPLAHAAFLERHSRCERVRFVPEIGTLPIGRALPKVSVSNATIHVQATVKG